MADFASSAHPASRPSSTASPAFPGRRPARPRAHRRAARPARPAADALPPVFHVAGTNGKGSTCAFLRAALEAAGRTVHMFTSPHLVRFNERIRIAGRLIDDDALAGLLEEVLDAGDGIDPSFFEVTTAAASSPSPARRPTPASSKSASADGSTRPIGEARQARPRIPLFGEAVIVDTDRNAVDAGSINSGSKSAAPETRAMRVSRSGSSSLPKERVCPSYDMSLLGHRTPPAIVLAIVLT